MARLKVKKELIGAKIKINPSLTLVFSEYMSDCEYQFALKEYPKYFEKPKSKGKGKGKSINLGGYDSDK